MKLDSEIRTFGDGPGRTPLNIGSQRVREQLLKLLPRDGKVTIQYLHFTDDRCIVQLLVPDTDPDPGFEGGVRDVSILVAIYCGMQIGPLGGVEVGEWRGSATHEDLVAKLAEGLYLDKQALTCVEL